jgi:hypothetical protein
MADSTEMEGTGEELGPVLRAMPRRRFRVLLLPEAAGLECEACAAFYEVASAEEWTRAFGEWAQTHVRHERALSDETASRDSIYRGRS